MKYKQYKKYKDSGIEWIGEIPEEWKISRNKFEFYISKKPVNGNSSQFKLLSMGYNGVYYRDVDSGKGKFPANFDTYQIVEPDDLIFCLFDMDETPRTIGHSKLNGMITSAYDVVKSLPHTHSKFIYYYYLAIDYHKGLRPFYTGMRKVVRPGTFLGLRVISPPIEEQIQIGDFLDKQTAQFDELIAKSKEQITLLEEKRQATITQAVTKGLDPSVPMKDSGIEWIGEIPEHWIEIPLKYEYKIQKGKIPSNLSNEKTEKSIPYLSMDYLRGSSNHIYAKKNDGIEVNDNDLLILWDGSNSGEILKSRCGILSSTMAVLNQIGDKLDPEYSFYQLKFFEEEIRANTIGMGIPHVDGDYIRNLKLILPTKEEQKQIAEFLGKQTAQFDELIAKSKQQITLLEEKKQALITATVTGKIDVRNGVAA